MKTLAISTVSQNLLIVSYCNLLPSCNVPIINFYCSTMRLICKYNRRATARTTRSLLLLAVFTISLLLLTESVVAAPFSPTKKSKNDVPKTVDRINKRPVKDKDLPATTTVRPPKKRTPADNHPLALASQQVIKEKGIVRWLLSPEKLPWTLCSIASLLYLVLFIGRVSCDNTSSSAIAQKLCQPSLKKYTEALQDGFCVWGFDETLEACPFRAENSHQFSFLVDMSMTALTFVVGHLLRPDYIAENNLWTLILMTSSTALMIFLHGILHYNISKGTVCHGILKHCVQICESGSSGSGTTTPAEWALYIIYNFGLVLMTFAMANFKLPLVEQSILVVLITVVWVFLGAQVGSNWSLPAVFVQSHVMVSLTGVFANRSKLITPLTGWCFLVATCVGLLEFMACKPFLLARYGHVWYDTALHVAMIASLVPRHHEGPKVVVLAIFYLAFFFSLIH